MNAELTREGPKAAMGQRNYQMPRVILHYCMKCGHEVAVVYMRRGRWTAPTGWVDAEWSGCCSARVASVNG